MTDLLATCWTHAGTAHPVAGYDVSPLSWVDRVDAVQAAGFRGIGIDLGDIRAAGRSGLDDLALLIAERHLDTVEIELLTDWWKAGPSRDASDIARTELFQAARVLGARHIKICGDLAYRKGDALEPLEIDRLAPALRELAREAADNGTRVALEFMPLTNIVTVAQARQLIETVDHPTAGICVDVWHVERGGSPLGDLAALPPELVFAVEIDDAAGVRIGSFYEDTIYNRRLPGDGDFDLPGFVEAVRATGFDGLWGVEILSNVQRVKPMQEAVREAFAAAKRALGE